MQELIGWIGTGITLSSYFAKDNKRLKLTQLVGSLVWLIYGILLHSTPIVVANSLNIGAILLSFRAKSSD